MRLGNIICFTLFEKKFCEYFSKNAVNMKLFFTIQNILIFSENLNNVDLKYVGL